MSQSGDVNNLSVANQMNPLVEAARSIFAMALPLRGIAFHPDIEVLRRRLISEVQLFEQRARSAGVGVEVLAASRYCICTFLDEVVSSTPWGGGGAWATRNLLVTFHNEVSGGEKFFLILQKNAQEPKRHRALLELMYLCLALGFEGKYRLVEGGREQLFALRERLHQILKVEQGIVERDLSKNWQGVSKSQGALSTAMYLWLGLAAGCTTLLVVYFIYLASLSNYSDSAFHALAEFKLSPTAPREVPRPAQPGRWTRLLQQDIADGRVAVREAPDLSVITVLGEGMFPSGGAELAPEYAALIGRIGAALASTTGKIRVTGHTDDQKIVTARFPSNWELSLGRARTVAGMLSAAVGDTTRVRFDGQGDLQPLVPNDSAINRARNRRVDVTLYSGVEN